MQYLFLIRFEKEKSATIKVLVQFRILSGLIFHDISMAGPKSGVVEQVNS